MLLQVTLDFGEQRFHSERWVLLTQHRAGWLNGLLT